MANQTESGQYLTALKRVDPAKWESRVKLALFEAGTVIGAARLLGVSHRTLCRWLAVQPALKAAVALSGRPATVADSTVVS